MRYISTRGNAASRSFKEILLEGLAPDGGLYMPESYPELRKFRLWGQGYVDVALSVLNSFAPDISWDDLQTIVRRTYTKEAFCDERITPVEMLEPNLGLLRLSNGPTLAFKDVPLQLLGALMEHVLRERNEELNILGATSGDTGSAAAYAVRGKRGLRLFMLSPYGRMSRFQQRQMYTLDEPNIFNLVANGTFDDCQAVVKEVNADAEFKKKYKLGAVNSINWARIAAQVVYCAYAFLHVARTAYDHVTFAVPSGNFGNALSAHIARQMGLPIDIIVCTNENDVLDEFFRTGAYRVRASADVRITSSPSMDIASASNFERFMFDYVDRDAQALTRLWAELKEKGQFSVRENDPGYVVDISSGKATEAEVLATIHHVYEKYDVIIDPHTAVAMKVALERRDKDVPMIVAETAQPAKFGDTIREALGFEPPVPKGYERLADLPEHTTRIDPDAETVKQFIAAHVQ